MVFDARDEENLKVGISAPPLPTDAHPSGHTILIYILGIMAILLAVVMLVALISFLIAKRIKQRQQNKLALMEATRQLYNEALNSDGNEEEENPGQRRGTLDDEEEQDKEEGDQAETRLSEF